MDGHSHLDSLVEDCSVVPGQLHLAPLHVLVEGNLLRTHLQPLVVELVYEAEQDNEHAFLLGAYRHVNSGVIHCLLLGLDEGSQIRAFARNAAELGYCRRVRLYILLGHFPLCRARTGVVIAAAYQVEWYFFVNALRWYPLRCPVLILGEDGQRLVRPPVVDGLCVQFALRLVQTGTCL